jgi:sarcosine/dimethylglycine N-methyltransferase
MGNANFLKQGVDKTCKLIEADCHKMPFEDGAFDCAYAIYSLKYFVNLEPVLQEISRVLKPGGRFVGTCHLTANFIPPNVYQPSYTSQICIMKHNNQQITIFEYHGQ